jgi:hypothetical protein
MSVLDPFEVFEIEVWPLPQYKSKMSKEDAKQAANWLNALEYQVHQKAISESKFSAILNEKDPPAPDNPVALPVSVRGRVVSDEVFKLRSHPDTRIARRSQIISRLAQTISERQVQGGLRRTLLTQARRLQDLSTRRYEELGGERLVEIGSEDADERGKKGVDEQASEGGAEEKSD